ncbi:MAG: SCP2 sterol-binding domain-containing protein [Acidimicrobiales bacterium]
MSDTTPDLGSISSPEDLAAILDGRTDDEVNEVVVGAGVDDVLGQISNAMVERFQADKAAGQDAVIQWDITAPDGVHTFHLTVKDGTCTATPGPGEAPRVTLGLALPDFLRFIAGQLEGMQAFMTGKLKLAGDMMFAQSMQTWFAV